MLKENNFEISGFIRKKIRYYDMEFVWDIFQIRIIIALVMLGTASFLDLWKREINDLLWAAFGVVAIALVFFEPNLNEFSVQIAIALIIVPFALILWRFGMFGGADAFALIVLAGLAPQLSFSENIVTPLTVLTNAALLSVVILFVNLLRNIISILRHQNIFEGFEETRLKKTIAMFIGYRAKNPKFGFSIERTEGKHKQLEFSLHNAETTEFCNTPNTWITPGMPYILYIAAGFLVQIFHGDIIFNFFRVLF